MAKFPWGDDAFRMDLMFVITFIVSLLLGVLLALVGPSGAVDVAPVLNVTSNVTLPGTGIGYPTAPQLHGVGLVTCVFMIMWYIFLGNQVGIKFSGLKDAKVAEGAKYIADRAVINTMEQALPFLTLMWLEAIFVNPLTAMRLGWIYVIFRFLYPILFGMFGQFTVAVEFSAQPGYIIIFYNLLTVFFKCLNGTDIHAKITLTSAWLMLPFLLLCGLCSFICYLLLAMPTTKLIINGVKRDQGCESDYEDEEGAFE